MEPEAATPTDFPSRGPLELSDQIELFKQFFEVSEEYNKQLHEQVRVGHAWVNIDFNDLAKHNPELADLLLDQPEDVLKACQIAIEKMDLPHSSDEGIKRIEPRIMNLPEQAHLDIRIIRSKHLNRFVQLVGIVRQKSDVRPQMTAAKFECPSCGNIIPVLQLDQKFKEPSRCGCGRKGKFKLLSKELVDAQSITLEEAPEDLDGGEQPKRLKIFLKNDLVSPLTDKRTNPGAKITVVGVIKEVPIILATGGQSTRFDLIVDANFVDGTQEDFGQIELTPEEELEIKELSQDPDLLEKFVASIAPSIYGHEPIKQALILQLFGGVHKNRDKGVKSRGDIHILLIGDPGSGKSQLLKRISNVAPKARFVSGKGASGAGMTAAVVKDEFLKGWALEAGALVLANRGICCTTEDATFILENGQMMTFKKLFENISDGIIYPSFKVLALNNETLKIEPFAIKHAFKKKNDKKVLKIVTKTGRELKLTEDNEVLTCENAQTIWKQISEMNIGAYLAVPKKISITQPIVQDSDFAQVAGWIASDGNIRLQRTKGRTAFYNTNTALISAFTKKLDALNISYGTYLIPAGKTSIIRGTPVTTKLDSAVIYNSTKGFATQLVQFGVPSGNKSTLHPLSTNILSYDETTIASFLRGVFDGDGSIRYNPFEVTLTTGIKENAQLFQLLFTRLGIVSSVKKSTHSWHCNVRGAENCCMFFEKIGTDHPEKLQRFKEIVSKELKDRIDVLPEHQILFKKIISKNKQKLGKDHFKYIWNYSKANVNAPKSKLRILNEKIQNEELAKHLDSDILWDQIVSLEEIDVEYVYDFTMEGTNNFIANNILMHNCIDELDKMTKEDTSALHEGLEQQTITISKANIQATLRCETTVLAAANPKFGRFDPYEMISKQIELPPTLLNRFDLIFPVRDMPDKTKDEKLASFILNLHKEEGGQEGIVTPEKMKKYIAYARQRCYPKLTEAAMMELKDYYVKMRGGDDKNETTIKAIPISARQLEALVRLSEASAKLRLSDKVTKRDAQTAIELVHYCLQQIGMDPDTGKIDIDRITTGISASQRSHISMVKEIILALEKEVGKMIPIDDVLREAGIKGIAEDTTQEVIDKLKRGGDIYSPKHGFVARL